MKVSHKSDYALRALVTLAATPDKTISIRDIAKSNDIPKRFLEHIMLELKNAGVVKGIPGREGGYTLALPASEIKVGAVIRLFDRMLAPIGCVSIYKYERCTQEDRCRFRRFFLHIRNTTAHLLDTCSLEHLVNYNPVTHFEINDYSVENGEGI